MWDYSPKPVRVASPSSGTSSTLAKYNMELAKLDSYHRVSDAFEVCQKMKEEGVVPDKTTYDHLLSLCGAHLMPLEAWAILEDMISVGIPPDRSAFHHVMRVSAFCDVSCIPPNRVDIVYGGTRDARYLATFAAHATVRRVARCYHFRHSHRTTPSFGQHRTRFTISRYDEHSRVDATDADDRADYSLCMQTRSSTACTGSGAVI